MLQQEDKRYKKIILIVQLRDDGDFNVVTRDRLDKK